VVVTTPGWVSEEGIDAGVDVVNLAQSDPRLTHPLQEERDPARLVALRLLCISGSGKGRDEGRQVLIEIGLTGWP
jgi:hypothetical protein